MTTTRIGDPILLDQVLLAVVKRSERDISQRPVERPHQRLRFSLAQVVSHPGDHDLVQGATYNGDGLYAAMLRQDRWRSLPAELGARARREKRPMARVAAQRLIAPLLPDWIERLRPSRPGRFVPGERRRNALSFLNASLAKRVAAALPPPVEWSNRATDRIQMLTESYLVARADRWSIIGARHGVAFSYPLADRRILDFALSLPGEQHDAEQVIVLATHQPA